jgi:hypothetical protein
MRDYFYLHVRWFQRLCSVFCAALVLASCNTVMPQLPPELAEAEATNQFVTVPLSQAWLHVPKAVIVTERGLVNSMEQRIGLVNRTAVSGDNVMVLRARVVQGQRQGRFRYDEFVRRIGGLPAPFTDMKSGDLATGEDALGTYLWAENRSGANTICVLGLRRLDAGMQQLPDDTNVLDVMMRNCVNGDLEQALAPMMASSISNIASAGSAAPSGGIQMLSPLAGPTP